MREILYRRNPQAPIEWLSPEEYRRRLDADAEGKRFAFPEFKGVERGRWVWDRSQGRIVPADEYHWGAGRGDGLQVIRDIEPYRNIAVDNGYISGRRQHRDMLRAHGLVEMGNEGRNPTHRREKLPDPRHDVKRAIEMHAAGYRGAPVERIRDTRDFREY